jgi:hAT family C-terminal dimerisation region
MDKLEKHLNPCTGRKYHPAIKAAMKVARNKMNRYYSLTDVASAYRIAMVLHPGLKLEYFKQQKWEEEWIETAVDLTRDEYMKRCKGKATDDSDDSITEALGAQQGAFLDFANVSVNQTVPPKSIKLDEYLRQAVENVANPLKWWYANRSRYPILHRMALDYLSIPATSTEVERVFSQGRHLLHFTQNSLSPSLFRACLCLGSWGRQDMVVFEDILHVVKSSKRKRGTYADSD